jgi:hypothetical protein
MAAHESAGADEALREAVIQGERAVARDMALIAQALQAHGALHPDLSVEEATDILLLLVSALSSRRSSARFCTSRRPGADASVVSVPVTTNADASSHPPVPHHANGRSQLAPIENSSPAAGKTT